VTFFQQGTLPCVSADGRFIMETPYRVQSSSTSKLSFDLVQPGVTDFGVCNLIYEFAHGVQLLILNFKFYKIVLILSISNAKL
jgi:hypothetical protein